MQGRGDSARRSRFPLARGTPRWLVPLWAGALGALLARSRRTAPALLGGALLTSAFFRDPERAAPPHGVLAPADGIVTRVDRMPDGRARIATFMAIWDVHVNRAPMTGVVRSLEHVPGAKKPALHKDSDRNERVVWTIETPEGELGLVQIAGALARRIVPYAEPGGALRRGERIGLIRFGSRVDVVLPAGLEAGVRVGRRLRAGQDRIDAPG